MYGSYFGLRATPFSATPDPRLFYDTAAYREAYATLLHGVRERKGFIALIGEIGTGKTTLLRRLMDELTGTVRFVFFYNTTLTFDETVEFICAELGLSVAGLSRVQKLQRLNDFLIAEARKGGGVVLLIDEAQNLGPEVLENLRLISNLETSTEKLLQIVLVGQPELETKLADPALRQVTQRIAVRYRLRPLHDAEIEPFIRHRLRRCGRPRQDLFTAGAIGRITTYSHGIPRVINILCDAALLLAYALDAKRVSRTMMDEVASDLGLRSRSRTARGGAGRWATVSLATTALVVAAVALLSGLVAAFGDVRDSVHVTLGHSTDQLTVPAAALPGAAAAPPPQLIVAPRTQRLSEAGMTIRGNAMSH